MGNYSCQIAAGSSATEAMMASMGYTITKEAKLSVFEYLEDMEKHCY